MVAFAFVCTVSTLILVLIRLVEKCVSPVATDKLMHRLFDEDLADKVIDILF